MANFINYRLADAQAQPEPTTVVGDIERWAELYLDTGQHFFDWNARMLVMMLRWEEGGGTADCMLSSVLPADSD